MHDESRDGSNPDRAVIIRGASGQDEVDAEYQWLLEHFPGFKTDHQSKIQGGGRVYDLMRITTADGQLKQIFFDISDFFSRA